MKQKKLKKKTCGKGAGHLPHVEIMKRGWDVSPAPIEVSRAEDRAAAEHSDSEEYDEFVLLELPDLEGSTFIDSSRACTVTVTFSVSPLYDNSLYNC
jgi:hypothetical protein